MTRIKPSKAALAGEPEEITSETIMRQKKFRKELDKRAKVNFRGTIAYHIM